MNNREHFDLFFLARTKVDNPTIASRFYSQIFHSHDEVHREKYFAEKHAEYCDG